MKTELDYIRDCLNKSGRTFGWEDFSNWTNYNFEVLSDDILEKTGIAISSRTLRRLANAKSNHNPQTATKNALANYIGYQNWEHLMLQNQPLNQPEKLNSSQYNSFITNYFWLLLISTVLLIAAFFIFFYPAIELRLNKSKVIFYGNDTKGNAPHTASFFYDVTKIKSSNIYVDNNFYDKSELVPVKKNMHYYTHTFELPDYYAVKIIANGERLSCVGVHVVTNGWQAVVNNKLYPAIALSNDSGYMHLPPIQLTNSNINTDSIVRVDFRNIRDFGLMGDDMTFETRFMNNALIGGQGCYDSKVEIINTHGRLSFNFVMPGCDEKMLQAEFGDVSFAGAFNNLNTFFQDISYWRVLKIVTKKKKVGVYLDDVQIYSVGYNDPLDDVKGISFNFMGSGAVDYVKLYNSDMELIYHDDFNEHQNVLSSYR
jgi:hypothetical protein